MNKEIKQEFIKYYIEQMNENNNQLVVTATKNRLQNLFEKVEPFENFYKKDCFDFSKTEILNTLASFGSFSVSTLKSNKSFLNMYTQWANLNNIATTGINAYESVTQEDLVRCVGEDANSYRLITEDKLNDVLKQTLNPSDQYLLLGLYEGIRGEDYKELMNLREEDIDTENCTFYLRDTDRTVKVPRKLVNYALDAIHTYEYDGCKREGGRIVAANLNPNDDTPIKGRVSVSTDDTKNRVRRVTRRMRTLKGYFDDAPELSVPRLFMAGFVNKIKKLADDNKVSYNDVWSAQNLENSIMEICQQYGMRPQHTYELKHKYGEYFI